MPMAACAGISLETALVSARQALASVAERAKQPGYYSGARTDIINAHAELRAALDVAIPRRSRSGRRRSPAGGHQRAPMARAGRRHGTAGGGHATTATSARSPWCSAAVRWEAVSTPGRPPGARAACTPRSSDAAARRHIPPVSRHGRARERAAHTSAAPAPRPAQAILFPPPAESCRTPMHPGDRALFLIRAGP